MLSKQSAQGGSMNREDVIRMAREADIHVSENNSFADDMYISTLYRFANVVAAAEREALKENMNREFEKFFSAAVKAVREAEREACAKVCDAWSKRSDDVGGYCAAEIRARGNT